MSTQLSTSGLSSIDSFNEVAVVLNAAGEFAGKANAALDPGVKAVDYLASAITDVNTFMAVLKDLDEAVTITEEALTAASSLLEELGIGELFDAIATALKAAQKAYKTPLDELEKLDAETIQKLAPNITKLQNALQKAQKELALAQEELPQYARTVELVGALLAILNAVVTAFPAGSAPAGKLTDLLNEWKKTQDDVHNTTVAVTGFFKTIEDDVASALHKLEDKFKPAENVVAVVMAPARHLGQLIRPWSEKIHHAIANIAPLRWLVQMMDWLGKAIDWLLDQISLGTVMKELGEKVMEPALKALHIDGIAKTIEKGLPGDVERHLDTLKDAPTRLAELRDKLKAYKTADGKSPLVPFIHAALDAITQSEAASDPEVPYWNPPPVTKKQTVEEAVANRMKYVTQYDQRGATYARCFHAVYRLSPPTPGVLLQAAPNEHLPKITGGDDFPPATLNGEWDGLTKLRTEIAQATNVVAKGTDDVNNLEQSLAAFDEQAALAPLLAQDMAEISTIWNDVRDIVVKVESIAPGTILKASLSGFAKALDDQAKLADTLATEAKRFQKNAAALDALVKQADSALKKSFTNAVSHQGGTYVDAVQARYNSWSIQTNTLPQAIEQLTGAAADKSATYAPRIGAVRVKVNNTALTLVTAVKHSEDHTAAIQQAVRNLITELQRYGAGAAVMAQPVQEVRNHQHALHTVDHYLNFADSILDPLSWLLRTYVCKSNKNFTPIQGVVTNLNAWGNSHLGEWLETGVRDALDALGEAEGHIGHVTALLSVLNEAIEKGGLERAGQAVEAINAQLAALDNDLAVKNEQTKTDWLDVETDKELAALAQEILSTPSAHIQARRQGLISGSMMITADAATPAERLQWWQNFNYPVYEVASLISVFGPMLVDLVPETKRAVFQNALVKLQHVAVDLHHIIKTDIIGPLEKQPPEEPKIPEIALPHLPPWDSVQAGTQSGFAKTVGALIPVLAILGNRLGKGSDIGKAVAALIVAVEDVAKDLVIVKGA